MISCKLTLADDQELVHTDSYIFFLLLHRYNFQINGMTGVLASFLVAFRHLIPEHLVQVFGGTVSIRVKNLLGMLTAATIVTLILFQTLVVYNLVNLGWVVAWAYLRFFKWQDGVQGDRSETFALYTFFPDFLQ